MAGISVSVTQKSRPKLTFVLTDFRNLNSPSSVVDITGYAFKLMAKRDIDDPDAQALFDLDGVIEDATNGVYSFQLSIAHTHHPPGDYPGEIRFWDDGDTTKPPSDRIQVNYTVEQAVDSVI